MLKICKYYVKGINKIEVYPYLNKEYIPLPIYINVVFFK